MVQNKVPVKVHTDLFGAMDNPTKILSMRVIRCGFDCRRKGMIVKSPASKEIAVRALGFGES